MSTDGGTDDPAQWDDWPTAVKAVQAGERVLREEFVPEGDSGHGLFWARRGISGR